MRTGGSAGSAAALDVDSDDRPAYGRQRVARIFKRRSDRGIFSERPQAKTIP